MASLSLLSMALLSLLSTALGAPDFTVRVDTEAPPTHRVNKLFFGCHSDSGFTHQVRSFSSQMIFGESFEAPQPNASIGASSDAWSFASNCNATSTVETATVAPAMHGASSRRIAVHAPAPSGSATEALLRNRGLGNEGLYFEGGKPYEGYFFARCDPSQAPVKLLARLATHDKVVLAETKYDFKCGATSADWVRLNFSMVPAREAACVGIPVGSDPDVHCTKPTNEAGHACVRCAGEFQLGLAGVGSVAFDYVVLQPGVWGRLGDLPVKRSTANALLQMGITAMRVGGSFASVTVWPDGGGGTPPSTVSGSFYQWQKWTGPPWLRPSVGAVWDAYDGRSYSLIGGWGPFEVIDMCNALGIEPIMTTTSSSSPAELADLVEYCHGDASTPMGRKRIADGHPHTYRVRFFELGNEQYNTRFAAQVGAMEERAGALGLSGLLHYIFPDNGGVRGKDVDAVKKLGIDASIAADVHVGAGGGLDAAAGTFARRPDFGQSAVNLETNAGTHTHARALQEAADLNAFFAAPAETQRRVLVRTASFCTERSGHFDNFDQGISFYLPNMTWLQPPGHVHAMIARARHLNARNVTLVNARAVPAGGSYASNAVPIGRSGLDAASGLSVTAQSSDNETQTVVRIVNPFASPIGPSGAHNLSLAVEIGESTRCSSCSLTVLAADPSMANPSWAPDLVAPVPKPCTLGEGGRTATVSPLVPFSYSVLELSGCGKAIV